ncbi:MAG: GNAT family N-acetyltransferase [Phormidesmis sp.]
MNVRTATHLDRDAIHHIHWSAFAAEERDLVAKLAVDLLSEKTSPSVISLVAESEGLIVGHVAFSPVTIESDEAFQGFILGPLGVMPDYQKRRIGTKLVESGIQQLSKIETDILFVYGDPKYYGRFGFSVEAAEPYIPPYKLQYPFGWQAVALRDYKARRTSASLVVVPSLSNPALW